MDGKTSEIYNYLLDNDINEENIPEHFLGKYLQIRKKRMEEKERNYDFPSEEIELTTKIKIKKF